MTVDLTAQNNAFDKRTITAPAGAQVTINFNNRDQALSHNFALYTNQSAATPIFVGQIVTGISTTYRFTAPAQPGDYFFRCDVHPTLMTGTFTVTAGSTATPSPTVTPTPTVRPTVTPTPTATPLATVTPTPTVRPTVTPTPTVSPLVTPTPTARPTATPAATAAAVGPQVKIVTPLDNGFSFAGPIAVALQVSGFTLADKLGQANIPGQGHIHYFLDVTPPTAPGQPAVTAAGTYVATIDIFNVWNNVGPGQHTFS
ncbi:MAG: cupredoxin domain-containing protein, partial [Chloroflexi bacterium]|nr:cupredoxin domain-containing protein [Chloroflexota bacterium]